MQKLRFVLRVLIASGACSVSSQAQEVAIHINQQNIYPGDPIMLTWRAPASTDAYITGYGKVTGSGEVRLFPATSTEYKIILEKDSKVFTESAKVLVEGVKGSFDKPALDEFQYGQVFPTTSKLIPLFDRVKQILQDSLHLTFSEFSNSGSYFFVTNRSSRPDLVSVAESARIRTKRVAYLIEIKPLDAASRRCDVGIKCVIEYLRRGEETWRKDSNDDAHNKAVTRAKRLIFP